VTIYSTPKYPVEANKVGPFHSLYYNQFENEISEIQPEKEEHKVFFFFERMMITLYYLLF